MRSMRITLGGWLAAGLVAVVALHRGEPLDAVAAPNPVKASVKCRKTIGQNVLSTVTIGLKTIQKCHIQGLKGRQSGDCNSLAGDTFTRARENALARIKAACKDGDPVAQNYGAPTVGQGIGNVFTAIKASLENSGSELQIAQ